MDSFSLITHLSPYYHILFTALAFLLSSLIFLFSRKKSNSKPIQLPPGPPGWPLVGNLFQVARSGKPYFQYVKDLIPKYGPIFTLKMGNRTLIIVSSAELAYEALIEKGQIFSNRPKETPTRSIFSCNKFSVNAAYHGPIWRSLRRNMVQNMLSSSRVKEFKNVREAAMDKLVARLEAEAEANDGAVWVLKNARYVVFCILLAMCFGIDMDDGDLIAAADEMMKTVLISLDPRIDDFLPILSPFFSKVQKRVITVRENQLEFIVPLIHKRRLEVQNRGLNPKAASFSYLDTLFDLKIQGRKSSPSDEEIVTLCSEFLNGGTDTTATALEWAIARLIQNPDIQSRLYDEIRSTVGDEKKVGEKDVEKMPYLNAVVKEVLRKHPPTAFSLDHAVTEAAKLAGYDIPTDAHVEFFLSAISEDPKIWSDPERFDPDRFFKGREDADITGSTGVKMMPFGVGRRICPGLGLGTVHINMILARMVQTFEWSGNPDNGPIDFSEKMEFTIVMKNTLRAKIKKREMGAV